MAASPAGVHGSGRLTRRCFAGTWVREVTPGGGVQHQPPWLNRRQTQEHYMPASTKPASAFRLQVNISQELCVCKAKTEDSAVSGFRVFATVPSCLLAAEKEEAKAVLSLFLRKQGMSNAVASRIINKSDQFIDHLISKLHSVHKSRYLVGRELTTLEIRNALVPYVEALLDEHGNLLIDVVENFPNPPGKGKQALTSVTNHVDLSPKKQSGNLLIDVVENFPNPPGKGKQALTSVTNHVDLTSKKQRAIARVSERCPQGHLPAHVLYLIDLGMDLDQIKDITRRFPAFAYYNLDRKIKPVVEFLFELGVSRSGIATILYKRPQLCGISFSENLKPMMTYLENLGVDKNQWAKVIYRFPALLTYSRQKVKTTVDYLSELGVSAENIGKILTRCPHIISYSVDDKLRPTSEYFQSLGVDVGSLIHRCPQTFGLSIEDNLKPVTEFFLERGYTIQEIATMISKYGALYTFSLSDNLKPKWEFFLTMDYPRSELVKFPHYFGYSLEERIKPRFARVRNCGVSLVMNQVLSLSESDFERLLQKKVDKLSCSNSK